MLGRKKRHQGRSSGWAAVGGVLRIRGTEGLVAGYGAGAPR